MKRTFAIALTLVLAAAGALWLTWRFVLAAPAMESSPVIETAVGHAYQFVAAPDVNWNAARTAASRLSWREHRGYLATIKDAAEYQRVLDRVFAHGYPDVTYLGGRQTVQGEWRWVTGPDGAADGGKGMLLWRGYEQGAAQNGRYANWIATAFQHGGKWDAGKVCCVSLFILRRAPIQHVIGQWRQR